MRINGAKIAIFAMGAAVGAVVSAVVTRKLVDETYRKAADDEIYKAWQESKARYKKYQDQIKDLEEKISQQNVTIKAQADQIRSYGDAPVATKDEEDDDSVEDDPGHSVHRSSREDTRDQYRKYSGLYRNSGEDEADFPLEDDDYLTEDPELEEEMLEKSGPRVISETEFSMNCLDYGKEDLHYFLYDGKILSDDGEYLDNYAGIIGENWKLHGKNAGDEVYVRNDFLAADYRVIFTAGKGEDNIDYSGIWE